MRGLFWPWKAGHCSRLPRQLRCWLHRWEEQVEWSGHRSQQVQQRVQQAVIPRPAEIASWHYDGSKGIARHLVKLTLSLGHHNIHLRINRMFSRSSAQRSVLMLLEKHWQQWTLKKTCQHCLSYFRQCFISFADDQAKFVPHLGLFIRRLPIHLGFVLLDYVALFKCSIFAMSPLQYHWNAYE